ncbi:MAG: sigma-54-dependent Fis family transcriptional regulator [Candidatus Schekmanbacteria bacterium]|nr:sigma-54-dependent Fis family transcriptional regulator [Candidatus Schekmanbacteria bacterium]
MKEGSLKPVIFLADPNADSAARTALSLERRGYSVRAHPNVRSLLKAAVKHEPDGIVSELRLPDASALDLIRELCHLSVPTPVIILTANGDERTAVQTLQNGAFTYLPQPVDYDELGIALQRAVETCRLRRHARSAETGHRPAELIGVSPRIRAVREMIDCVAATAVTVLITGETGTGKDLTARMLHYASGRAGEPFVPVNCAAIPADLLESELFGYVKGAFTGADRNYDGKLLHANRGTLFLDEIGELPLALQPKLLRVLEERTVTPLGSSAPKPIDVRILAATNRNVTREVTESRFRADLYYRLNVISLDLPSLRERPEDIPLLASHLLAKLCKRHERPIPRITPALVLWLQQQPWPGNVRELENTLERMIVLSRAPSLEPPADAAAVKTILPFFDQKKDVLDRFERHYLVEVLQMCDGHLGKASRVSGISPRQLYNLMRKHDVQG